MASIYVTGATGQVGTWLSILAPDLHYLGRQELDLSRPESIRPFFSDKSVDLIIHAGAYTQVDSAESNRDLVTRINVESTGELANCASKFLYISSDYVYKSGSGTPLGEDCETDPINHYGRTKLAGEQIARESNPCTWVLRTSWLYSEYGQNFVKTMIRLSKERTEINVVDDQVGSPTYVHDLVKCILRIAEKDVPYGVYNFSNTGQVSWCDFAKEIMQRLGSPTAINPIESKSYPTTAKRPVYTVLDCTKISRHVEKPRHWTTALGECLKSLAKGG